MFDRSFLFDLNNLAIRCLFSSEVIGSDNRVDWDVWRYRIFNSIYSSIFQIKDCDEIVLAVDDRRSWRKLYFPRYKEKRTEKREKVEIDWDEYFQKYSEFKDRLSDHFPFKVLHISYAEADDIIGTLCLNIG